MRAELEQFGKLQEEAETRDQKLEVDQVQKLQQEAATRDKLKLELEQVQKLQQATTKNKERKAKTPSETLGTHSSQESKVEVDELPRATGPFNLERVAQKQMSINFTRARTIQSPHHP